MAIEIVDLAIENGDFPSVLYVYQRVYNCYFLLYPGMCHSQSQSQVSLVTREKIHPLAICVHWLLDHLNG